MNLKSIEYFLRTVEEMNIMSSFLNGSPAFILHLKGKRWLFTEDCFWRRNPRCGRLFPISARTAALL